MVKVFLKCENLLQQLLWTVSNELMIIGILESFMVLLTVLYRHSIKLWNINTLTHFVTLF